MSNNFSKKLKVSLRKNKDSLSSPLSALVGKGTAPLKVVPYSISSLVHPTYNPRQISPKDFEQLKKSIKEFGTVQPAVVNINPARKGIIVGGNQRVKAAAELGMKEYPCIEVNLNEKKERELNIRLNRNSGVFDYEILKEQFEPDELFDWGFDDGDHLDELFGVKDEKKEEDFVEDASTELDDLRTLEPSVFFKSTNKYGIPDLDLKRCAPPLDPIAVWCGVEETKPCDNYLWVYGKYSIKTLDMRKVIVAFYCDDNVFEKTWTDPATFTKRMINRNPYAIVAPNFSLWGDMPYAWHLWNTYRSRWMACYMQAAGINIIPDVEGSGIHMLDYVLAGIPVGCPCLSIQNQTAKLTLAEKYAMKKTALEIIKRIKPQSIIFYCQRERFEEILAPAMPKQLHVLWVQSRMERINEYFDEQRAERGDIYAKQKRKGSRHVLKNVGKESIISNNSAE